MSNTGPGCELGERDDDARGAQEVELARRSRVGVDADERPHPEPEATEGERAVRHGATEPPAAGVVGRDVTRRRADDEHGRRGRHEGLERGPGVSCGAISPQSRSHSLYFYELHEGDDDVFSDLLLVHDEQIEPEDFFELVQAVRAKVKDTFEEDTLIEAIALELEREHGFTFVSDARLSASVHVSPDEKENRLISIDDEIMESAEFRSVLADFDGDDARN